MKKITLLLVFLFLSFFGFSQGLPLEGFENTIGPDLPSPTTPTDWTLGSGTPGNQWAVFDNGTGLTKRWDIVTAPANVYAGTNSTFIDVENINANNTSEDYLATPLITVPTNGQLRFWTRTGSNGDQGSIFQIKVAPVTGTQINPADYTLIQQWTETSLTTAFNTYEEKVVSLNAFAGQQVYVAFVRVFTQPTAALGGDRWFIDNVQIIQQCLNPTGLTATAVTFNGASLSWTSPGVTSWEIEVLPAANVPTGVGVPYSGALPYVVTNLLPNTNYQFFVRSVCAPGNPSGWAGPINFTTTTAPPVCGGNFVDAAGPTTNYANNSDSTVTICPVTPGDQVTVTFTAFNTEATWDALYVFNGNSITAPQIASANPAGNVPGGLAGGYWGTVIPGPFTSTSPDGCLTFRFRSDPSVNNPGWIANVTCAPPPTCTKPTNLVASGATSTTVNLAWTQLPNPNSSVATTWQVLALPCGSPLPTPASTGFITASTNPFVYTGLTADTCYNFYVRAVCSPTETSDWSVGATATTQITPPVCGGTFTDPGGANANYANNVDNTVTICPTTPGDAVTVTFTSFNTQANNDGLYIFNGNSITAPQIASANPAGTVPGGLAGSYWGTVNPGTFTSSSPDGCLTFRFRTSAATVAAGWVANVTCAPAPACPQPISPVTSAVTFNSVTLAWTETGTATAWEVLALPCASPAPTAASTGFVAAPTNPFVLTGLNADTCYDIYVRAVCSPTSSSNWTGPRTITTQVAPPVCGGTFTDPGGANANYANNVDSTVTVCPTTPGDAVTVTFTSFNTQASNDGLYIFNGNSIAAPQIASANPAGTVPGGLAGSYWGTVNPGSFTSSSPDGCLTFRFRTSAATVAAGWVANVTCAPAPACPQPISPVTSALTFNSVTLAWTETGTATAWEVLALPCAAPAPTAATTGFVSATTNPFTLTGLNGDTCYNIYVRSVCGVGNVSAWTGPRTVTTPIAPPACGGTYTDPGGATANYANNTDSTVTICPTIPGQQVTVTFTAFNTEANWDALYVFNGNSIAAPQIPSTNPAANVPGGLAGGYWGTAIPGPFTGDAATGCLTFRFRSDGSVNNPGWVANVTCAPPPTCPRPTAVTVTAVTQTSALVGWTEMGTATQWEVLVLPAGSPVPTSTTTGFVTANTNPFPLTGLASGTQFVVYVRSHCSDTDISLWSNPGVVFATLITNDECANAVTVPVNPNTTCTLVTGGTVIGATASTEPNTCGGTDDDDVWFQFTATTTAHSISLNNITGSTTDLYHVLYSGTCGNLTQIYCSDAESSNATTLTPGQTYYVRVYTWTATPNQTSAFNVCIGTIPPPISATTAGYTNVQLIENVLLGTTCANVTNVTSSSGNNFGSVNGIGYFNQNGSSFPFAEGVVLSSGAASSTPGPNTTGLSEGTTTWVGDTDLEAIILAATGLPMNSRNASKLEFDFVPLTDQISFNFIFASEEYGTFQCDFSDAFAFLLTNVATGVTTNLAVIPSTTIPVSVVTIRNQLYNAACASANPAFFSQFYQLPQGVNPLGAPINFNGVTVPMVATSPVTPGAQYHIKMVIADRSDTAFDSAVFLEGGSFDIGNIELGQDFLQADGTALCAGETFTLNSGLNPAQYSFVWTLNGDVIPNQTGPTLTVSVTGEYGLSASYINTTCSSSDSVTIEFYDAITAGTPNNLIACNSLGFAQFDLFSNNASALGTLAPADYSVVYYLTAADAAAEVNPLPQFYTNTVQFSQTIYVRVENNTTGCFAINPFNLIVQDLTPQFTVTPSFSICAGSTGTITVTGTNYDPALVTYSWTLDGTPIAATTATISVTDAGVYEVTVNNSGCTATGSTTVSVVPVVNPTFNPIVGICQGSASPAFPAASLEGVQGTWNATSISTATSGTTTYIFTPNAGVCATTGTLSVTVDPLQPTTFAPIAAICQGENAPSLPTTSLQGNQGTWSPTSISTTTSGTFTFTFTPASGVCASVGTLTVTVSPLPQFEITGGCEGTVYVLEATPLNASYNPLTATYEWSNEIGAVIGNSATVNVTQNGVYTCVVTASETSCSEEVSFTANETTCTIQKGISPNGDGLNDAFELTGLGVKELSIYNRYGTKVYSKTSYTNQWVGQSSNGNELPDGTYYFVIDRVQGETKSGWIYINREN